MKGIKALTEDCFAYVNMMPGRDIVLTRKQIQELMESKRTGAFERRDGGFVFNANGKRIPVRAIDV